MQFAPFLSETITTDEQREAFETIIRYLDGVSIAVPSDVQQYLEEIRENADAAVTQSASSALAAAMADPEKYIHDNKEILEQYRAVAESEEYKASPAYRLQEYLKVFVIIVKDAKVTCPNHSLIAFHISRFPGSSNSVRANTVLVSI